jgi:hypothetical protein
MSYFRAGMKLYIRLSALYFNLNIRLQKRQKTDGFKGGHPAL